jgi:hypothetical protein
MTPRRSRRRGRTSPPADHPPASETARELEGVRILLVEDNAVNRQVATACSRCGAQVSLRRERQRAWPWPAIPNAAST